MQTKTTTKRRRLVAAGNVPKRLSALIAAREAGITCDLPTAWGPCNRERGHASHTSCGGRRGA